MIYTPEEYLLAIDVLRGAIIAAAKKNPDIMIDYEVAVIHSGLPNKKRFTVAQQQVAYREAYLRIYGRKYAP